jgi:zinc protease
MPILLLFSLTANLESKGGASHTSEPPIRENPLLAGIRIPELTIHKPEIKEIPLPEGGVLLEVNDSSLPYCTLDLHFTGGTNLEPIERTGSLEALAAILTIDGAAGKSGEEIARELSSMGAILTVHADYEKWSVSLTVLKRDFDRAFAILSDLLLDPALSPERLQVVQNGMTANIRQRNDDPSKVAGRKIIEALYPASRRGHTIDQQNIASLKPEILRAELQSRLRADSLYVAAGGDIEGLNLEKRVGTLLSRFPRQKERANPEDTPPPSLKQNPIVLVNVPATQAVIATGIRIPQHNHPDYYSLTVGNYILGGSSLISRLMQEIRTERGLAYYAYSRIAAGGIEGNFVAASASRTEKVAETLTILLDEIRDLSQREVTATELSLARESILNSLVFEFTDPSRILSNEVRFRMHGMPENYLMIFPEKIRATGRDHIQRSAARYLNPDNFIVIVAGPADQIRADLETIRPVIVVEPEDTDFLKMFR